MPILDFKTSNQSGRILASNAGVAQSVEQWTENPRVGSSILSPGILLLLFCLPSVFWPFPARLVVGNDLLAKA